MTKWRFTDWPPWAARLTLLALVLLSGYGLLLDVSDTASQASGDAAQQSDVALYRALVARLAAGEGYYAAVGDEQHRRGYPTKPFLTWRLPTAAWTISLLGENLAANVLRWLAVLAILAWIKDLKDLGLGRTGVVMGALLVYSSLLLMFPLPTLYLHESWAGALMALSLPLQQRWWRLSVLCGIAALAFRELALPFVLVMTTCALREGRWREAGWWMVGVTAWFIALALHAGMVTEHMVPAARMGGNWLAFGGWGFVLAANGWNILVHAAGGWLVALWITLALLGSAARKDPVGQRLMLTVVGYSVAFLFVGRGNNHYWGIIYGPLVAVSITFVPAALRALWHSARVTPLNH